MIIPYLFIFIYLFAYTFTNISVLLAKNILTMNNLLTKVKNKCFMNSNTDNHKKIYSKKLYSIIVNNIQLSQTV